MSAGIHWPDGVYVSVTPFSLIFVSPSNNVPGAGAAIFTGSFLYKLGTVLSICFGVVFITGAGGTIGAVGVLGATGATGFTGAVGVTEPRGATDIPWFNFGTCWYGLL